MFENKLTKVRLEKAERLRSFDNNPFSAVANNHKNDMVKTVKEKGENYAVNGRVIALRKMGKSGFATIKQEGESIQIFCSLENLGDSYPIFKNGLDIGDIVYVSGETFITKSGELTIKVNEIKVLTKALLPLPEKFHGLEDQETKYRKRHLDLIVNDTAEILKKRSKIINIVRNYLIEKDFVEVETPALHEIPGGANAKPFVTFYNALDQERYLRVAPELYLKKLIVGGLESVFEIGKNFRNEGVDATHNPEFTSVEFYKTYINYKNLIEIINDIFQRIIVQLNDSNPEIDYQGTKINFDQSKIISFEDALVQSGVPRNILRDQEALKEYCASIDIKKDLNVDTGKLWEYLFDELVEDTLINPTYITDYPADISPLARRNEEDPFLTERFELFIAGREIANGFNELNDPVDQYARFALQASNKDNDEESMYMDLSYIEALMQGMAPTAGAGIGLDRLVMLFTNQKTIKDVIAFPAMR